MTETAERPAGPLPGGVFPNAFIVGAPKCATTALAQYLGKHPQIAPLPKEIHHFGRDLDIRMPGGRIGREAYAARAAKLGTTAPVVLDASVFYLASETAAEEIHAFNPDARIIIMLRKPFEMMKSLHQQTLKSLTEEIEDFAEALAAEPERREGRRIPRSAIAVNGLFYRETARYATQLERYRAVFPPEQIQVILHDDVKADIRGVYDRACRFLGLEPDPAADLSPINEAASVRSRWLVAFQRSVIHRFELYQKVKAVLPKAIRQPLYNAWLGMLYKPLEKRPTDPALKAEITAEYIPEIERLETLLGRDLSAWKQ